MLAAKGTHYEVLGVPRSADAKAIKSAYFAFVATLHPDRHFRKALGPFKKKLEEVFVRLTSAYETLRNETARAAYDRSLPPPAVVVTALAVGRISDVGAPPPSLDSPSRARIRVRSTVPGMRAVSGPVRVAPSTAPEAPRSIEIKRKPATPGVDPFEVLHRFFDEKVEQEGRQRARVFAEAGEYELARGNIVAAATQFRLALDCCDTPEMRAALEAVEGKANARKAQIHLGLAEAAERNGQWADAASSYEKVHATNPEGRVAERLANAIRLACGDLRQAAKLAEAAVHRDPDNAGFRITLGEIYADAGLDVRAQAEAKRAIGLAPKDPRARSLMDRLSKSR